MSMRNNWKWVPGDPRWGIVHRGRTYWFASQAEQQQFWTDPDRYSPALSGMDPVMAIDHQQQVPGKREHSIDYDSLFYMFSSEATLRSSRPTRNGTRRACARRWEFSAGGWCGKIAIAMACERSATRRGSTLQSSCALVPLQRALQADDLGRGLLRGPG